MSDERGIIEYIEDMQKAKKTEDIDLYSEVKKLNDKPATYEDIEEAVAYTMRILGSYMMSQETVQKVRFDLLTDALLSSGSLSNEEHQKLQEQDDKLVKEIYKEEDDE